MNLKAMVRWGTINESEFKLLKFADTVDDAFEVIRSGLENILWKWIRFCRRIEGWGVSRK